MLDLRHGGGAREAELKETPVQVVAEPRGAQALLLVLCWARAWQGKGLLFRSRSRQGLLETRRACVILDSRFIISPSEVHGNRRGLSPPPRANGKLATPDRHPPGFRRHEPEKT